MKINVLYTIVFIILFPVELFGQRWYEIRTPQDKSFLSNLAYLENNIIAVDDILGVWVTTNKGFTWSRTLNTYNVLRMQSTNVVYAMGGIGASFIYKSDSLGKSWKNISTVEISKPYVILLAERNSKNSNEIFALGTKFGGDQPLLFRTTNGGGNWSVVSTVEPLNFREMVAGPGSLLYGLHRDYGFYRSTNNGATWDASISGITTTEFTSLRQNSQGFLFITSVQGKLFRSTDQGLSWHSRTSEFPDSAILSSLTCLSADVMYVLVKSGLSLSVHRSIDGGLTWLQRGDFIVPSNIWTMKVNPEGKIILLGTNRLFTNDSTFNVTSDVKEYQRNDIGFYLTQNYPNPFNPTTTIQFSVHQKGFVKIKVFDPLGREVTTLVERDLGEGEHEAVFDGTNHVSGMYFYQIQYNDRIETKRMVLIK